METEQGLELERFLTDNGYANLVTSFTSQDVTTLVAAKDLTLDDLKEHIGCAPLVAKKLFAKLHPEEGNGGSQQVYLLPHSFLQLVASWYGSQPRSDSSRATTNANDAVHL